MNSTNIRAMETTVNYYCCSIRIAVMGGGHRLRWSLPPSPHPMSFPPYSHIPFTLFSLPSLSSLSSSPCPLHLRPRLFSLSSSPYPLPTPAFPLSPRPLPLTHAMCVPPSPRNYGFAPVLLSFLLGSH